MKLTENFSLEEFTASETARENNISNEPTRTHVANLAALCRNVLQPLRDELGKPVKITSGYRCPELNEAVGGSETSQHQLGEAADCVVPGVELTDLYGFIRDNLVFDQLILEPGWIHVSFSQDRNRQIAWRAK